MKPINRILLTWNSVRSGEHYAWMHGHAFQGSKTSQWQKEKREKKRTQGLEGEGSERVDKGRVVAQSILFILKIFLFFLISLFLPSRPAILTGFYVILMISQSLLLLSDIFFASSSLSYHSHYHYHYHYYSLHEN